MDTFYLDCSKKKIPLPSDEEYKVQFISKVESLVKRMRQKALQFLGKLKTQQKESYGIRSRKCPPAVEELAVFEEDLRLMIKNIKFRKVNNEFQTKLLKDIKKIKNSKKVFVNADKSRNTYEMTKEKYEKYLLENVTKIFKRTPRSKINRINIEAKNIVTKLGIEDRVERLSEGNTYITVKDHKEEFPEKPSFRLINPSKSEIGKISKIIVDKVNKVVIEPTKLNQWKNTNIVIEWFKRIKK